MADGAATNHDSPQVAPAGTSWRGGGSASERSPLVVLPGRASAPRWARPLILGLPHLARRAVSESWLLKECGHRHGLMLNETLGRRPASREALDIRAAFTAVAVEDADLGAAEGDALVFAASDIRRLSRSQFISRQTLEIDGRRIATVRMISVVLRRDPEDRRLAVARAALRQLPSFGPTHAPEDLGAAAEAFRADDWGSFGGFRRLDRRLLRSFPVDPCPQCDFDGDERLYFASVQDFVDRAEWTWFRYADPFAATRRRHMFFYATAECGDTLDLRLCAVTRGPRHCAHWCEILRQSDGRKIADIVTERVIGR